MMSKKSKRVAICLVTDYKDDILMGCRNDNGRYTVPAGHIEHGEDPFDGAVREFKEETGLDADDIKLIGAHMDKEKNILLYLFKVIPKQGQEIDTSNDPDKECDTWTYKNPNEVADNLHVPIERNLALQYWIEN